MILDQKVGVGPEGAVPARLADPNSAVSSYLQMLLCTLFLLNFTETLLSGHTYCPFCASFIEL